jgi:peptidyl-prolyl cis-trans isomerase C
MKGLTIEKLKVNFNKRVYMDEYLKINGIVDPDIPEKNIRDFYESSPKNYYREESVKVSHILIKVDEKTTPEEKKKARKKAEQLRKDVLGGKDFAEMAKEHSECNSASGGGGLGYINKGYMPEEFEKAAFAQEKDAVSEVVETKFGFHIIKVLEKSPAGITPYEDVRDFIKKFLQEDESKRKLDAHLAELKKKAKIEIFID